MITFLDDEREIEFPSRRREMNDGRLSFKDDDDVDDDVLFSLFSGVKVPFEDEGISTYCDTVGLEYLVSFFVANASSSSFCSKHDAKVSSRLMACLSLPSSRKHLAMEKVMDAAFG